MADIKSLIKISKSLHEICENIKNEQITREDINNILVLKPDFIETLSILVDVAKGHEIEFVDEEEETVEEPNTVDDVETEEEISELDNEDVEESVATTNDVEERNDKPSDLNKYTIKCRVQKKKCSRHLSENEIDAILDAVISVDGMSRLKARDYLDKKYPSIGKRRIVDLLTGRTYGEKTNGLITIDDNDIVHINK